MDEPGFMAMGGQAEAISNVLRERHDTAADLTTALALAAEALGSVGGENGQTRTLEAKQLEVAVLDRRRRGRAFRRIAGTALTTLLSGSNDVAEKDLGDVDAAPPSPAEDKPTVSAASVDTEDEPKAQAADAKAGDAKAGDAKAGDAKAPAADTKAPDDPDEPADDVNGDGS